MKRFVAVVVLALAMSGCKIVTVAGGGTGLPVTGVAGTDIELFGNTVGVGLEDLNVTAHPDGGAVFTNRDWVLKVETDLTITVLYDRTVPDAPISGSFGTPAVQADGTVLVPVILGAPAGGWDASVLVIAPDGTSSVIVVEDGPFDLFLHTVVVDPVTDLIYVGIAADFATGGFGYTDVLQLVGSSLNPLPGAPSFPMGTTLFATPAIGFDVQNSEVYAFDVFTETLQKWDSAGIETTVAGNGIDGFSGDGGPAIEASFSAPRGIDVIASGAIYLADSGNNRIRKINADGTVNTLVGTGAAGFSGDEGEQLDAELDDPSEVAVNGLGQLWIADDDNERIRFVGNNVDPA